MDAFEELCKLSVKRVTSVYYVIIALILHNHTSIEGALSSYIQGRKGILQHQTCRKKWEKRFPLHNNSRQDSVLLPSGAGFGTDVRFLIYITCVNNRYWVIYKRMEAGTRNQDSFVLSDRYSH